ncbi:hypothetical protein [Erythrobacter rubeus]|uniref:DUF2267 domain-containing protein n=1 Tax=Erythrobacter rubeus TaxID=2760803 RepID=A0ABR8KSU6_9SPHN|nr:hypothetical protein [Erythrobacter rubeus]MBD2841504.1 hypothetical protein [Erythrobacter rubeus]
MSQLTKRERATAAAALLEIRGRGIDTREVTDTAATLIRMGTPEGKAYQRSFAKLLSTRPSLRGPLQRIETLVARSDIPTVARYNVALTNYMSSGDQAHLDSIAPTVAADLAQLSNETGDAGYTEMLPGEAPAPAEPSAPSTPDRDGWGPTGFQSNAAASEAQNTKTQGSHE